MLTNVDAVIFDVDGSLIDSMWVWKEVDVDYMKKYNLVMPQNFHESIEGMSFTETAQYFLDTFPNLDCSLEKIKDEWMEMSYDKYLHKVELKDGVKEFLAYAEERNIRFGIATSNTRELVEAVLEAHGIADKFVSLCTACDVCAGKPAPDVYLKAAEELHVQPDRCLVFEDVPNGILAGKNANMKVCAVDDDFTRPVEAKKKRLADYYIYNYFDIMNHTYDIL